MSLKTPKSQCALAEACASRSSGFWLSLVRFIGPGLWVCFRDAPLGEGISDLGVWSSRNVRQCMRDLVPYGPVRLKAPGKHTRMEPTHHKAPSEGGVFRGRCAASSAPAIKKLKQKSLQKCSGSPKRTRRP